jgi:aspartate carbamoyltransferase catalytic subunit
MKKDLISMNDLDLASLEHYLGLARTLEEMTAARKVTLMPGRVLMVMFYEPSTRTRLSFESAMQKLGGGVIGFSETSSTSVAKGESIVDTVLTCERYADAIVIRHPKEGTARLAAETAKVPIINAGDGTNQHPTQTLLDLYTIQKFRGHINNVKIAFVGDLKYSRTVHSLFQALMKFEGVEFNLVSPASLRLPDYLKLSASGRKMAFNETDDLHAAIANSDIVYMTRIQRDRFADIMDYEKVKNAYCLDAQMLAGAPDHLKVLHPLPRVNEISPDVDGTKYAGYFDQVENGVIMRQAILSDLMGVTL